MENYDFVYQKYLLQVEKRIEHSIEEIGTNLDIDITTIKKSKSTLDSWDYCYAIAIGLAGIFISSNEKFENYLSNIHKASSEAIGEYDFFQIVLGKLLHHKYDYIDSINGTFTNRAGENAYGLFHRLLWGHDILSIGKDNPLYLMFQQKGVLSILQAVRHLIADTTSKQGLPIPGSSLLDFVNDKGKTSNYLIGIAQKLSNEAFGKKAMSHEIYSHMLTIRMQDITGGAVIKVLSDIYIKSRKITDDIRYTQIRLVSYAIAFFGQAFYGCIKQKGVPYINLPLTICLGNTFAEFCYYNNKDINRLSTVTRNMITTNKTLIDSHAELSDLLSDYDSKDEHIESLTAGEKNIEELISFFEEQTK